MTIGLGGMMLWMVFCIFSPRTAKRCFEWMEKTGDIAATWLTDDTETPI